MDGGCCLILVGLFFIVMAILGFFILTDDKRDMPPLFLLIGIGILVGVYYGYGFHKDKR